MGGVTNAFQAAQISQMAQNDYQNALRIQQQIQAQQQQYGYKPSCGAGVTTADSFTPTQQTASLGLYNPQTASQTVGLGCGTLKMTGSGSDSSQSVTQQALQLEAQKTAVIQQMMAISGDPDASVTQAKLTELMTQYQAINQQENSLQSQMYYSQNYGGQNPPGMTMPGIPSVPLANMPSIPSVPLSNMPSIPSVPLSNMPSIPSVPLSNMPSNPSVPLPNMPSIPSTQNSGLTQQALALEAQKTALIQQMSGTTDEDKLKVLMTQYQAINTQENALSSQMYNQFTGGTAPQIPSNYPSAPSVPMPPPAQLAPSAPAVKEETKPEETGEPEAKGSEEDSDYIDPFEPLKNDLAAGAQEIADRQKAADAQRQASKNEYAAGDHGLGLEVVNQAWYNLKENVGNAVTVVKTAAKAAVDVVIVAPVRALSNVGKAVVQAAGETIKPTVQHIQQGIQEVKDRQVAVEADRQKSKSDYAAGNHGLAKEVVNQAWNNVKENVGNAVTAVKTTAKVAVDVVTAPARFLWNAAKNIFGGK